MVNVWHTKHLHDVLFCGLPLAQMAVSWLFATAYVVSGYDAFASEIHYLLIHLIVELCILCE